MVAVEEALSILTRYPFQPDVETVDLDQATGRILAEPVRADRDFPPYDRVAMDGITLNTAAYTGPKSELIIERTIAAGEPRYRLADLSKAVEIMTGAVLPAGCDAVVPYEELFMEDGKVTITGPVISGKNIHVRGSDRKAGEVIVPAGTRVGAPEAGIAATVGQSRLMVFKWPSICLVSTGDELVSVDEIPEPHQIRSSNVFALRASLRAYAGMEVATQHLTDDADIVHKRVKELGKKYQIIIFIGGSSMGKFDFLPSALTSVGFTEHFYKISQRPGKPMWFGSRENHFAFALPGNPVSCFLCLEKYFKFWLNNSLGILSKTDTVVLNSDFAFEPDLTYFLQVKLESGHGRVLANPLPGGGSGDHANLADADAFLELPRERSDFRRGEVFNIVRIR
jgi:molybdopterin molybdotransferase